jgi:hypothetical protein
VNPNYQGGEYDEYFSEEPVSHLDCHSPTTEWELLGVYRQEFYQFIEQISKHVWAIDDYEYVTALAGLSYMTAYDCFIVGYQSDGATPIYAGVAPQPYGEFQMALYTDSYCLNPDTSLGKTYDDYVSYTNLNLGSKDQNGGDYESAQEWWYNAQEYKLTELNSVYDDFKYCTSCVDYPTYQDGYFIGNDGTDDGDLINQCWKFHSHNSYVCDADCIAKGNAQGTILSVNYGTTTFGKALDTFYNTEETAISSTHHHTRASALRNADGTETQLSRLAANAFLTVSFLVFAATFLAFAVARRSRYRESRGTRSRRLLDDDHGAAVDDGRSRKSSKSKSARRSSGGHKIIKDDDDDMDGDGLFRSASTAPDSASRSKSKERKSGSSRNIGTSSASVVKSKKSRSKSYEPPSSGRTRSSSRVANNPADYR